ncbi:phage holin family protein [Bacillus sp. FSL W7-1360]
MEHASFLINMEHLEVAKLYLFGSVKFLDLLLLLMVIDVVTGILKAIQNKELRSRVSLIGYARKIGIFGIIILANVIDVALELNGMVVTATVVFYLLNEALSIVENAAQIGLPIPTIIKDKLRDFEKEEEEREQ